MQGWDWEAVTSISLLTTCGLTAWLLGYVLPFHLGCVIMGNKRRGSSDVIKCTQKINQHFPFARLSWAIHTKAAAPRFGLGLRKFDEKAVSQRAESLGS